jgi:hypothetical protein
MTGFITHEWPELRDIHGTPVIFLTCSTPVSGRKPSGKFAVQKGSVFGG